MEVSVSEMDVAEKNLKLRGISKPYNLESGLALLSFRPEHEAPEREYGYDKNSNSSLNSKSPPGNEKRTLRLPAAVKERGEWDSFEVGRSTRGSNIV
jgi:hypothetical protein